MIYEYSVIQLISVAILKTRRLAVSPNLFLCFFVFALELDLIIDRRDFDFAAPNGSCTSPTGCVSLQASIGGVHVDDLCKNCKRSKCESKQMRNDHASIHSS